MCDGGISLARYSPYKLQFSVPIASLHVGGAFSALLSTNGIVYTCGSVMFGQIGRKPNTCSNSFAPVDIGAIVSDISVGDTFMFAKSENQWYGWGNNENNLLYLGNQAKFTLPDRVDMKIPCNMLSCGTYHSICVSPSENILLAWGNSRFNQLGVPSPYAVRQLTAVSNQVTPIGTLSINYFHAFWYNKTSSSLLAWGRYHNNDFTVA